MTNRKYYSEANTMEMNRERYEYRTSQSYTDPGGIQEKRPYIASVGRIRQVRIMQQQDDDGNNITPRFMDFFERGRKKQPKPKKTGEGTEPDEEWFGVAAS